MVATSIAQRTGDGRVPELKLYVGGAVLTADAGAPVAHVKGISVRAVTMFIVLGKDQSKWSDIIVKAVHMV